MLTGFGDRGTRNLAALTLSLAVLAGCNNRQKIDEVEWSAASAVYTAVEAVPLVDLDKQQTIAEVLKKIPLEGSSSSLSLRSNERGQCYLFCPKAGSIVYINCDVAKWRRADAHAHEIAAYTECMRKDGQKRIYCCSFSLEMSGGKPEEMRPHIQQSGSFFPGN